MSDRDERTPVSIFSLSFLDVFACALGALILILLMIINQVSTAVDSSEIKSKIQQLRERQTAVASQTLDQTATLRAAEVAAEEMEALRKQLEAARTEIAALDKVSSTDPAVLSKLRAEVEALKSAQVEARRKVLAQREAPSTSAGPATGTGTVTQQPRMLVLLKDRVRDITTNTDFPVGSGAWQQLLEWFKTNRASYYPLMIVKPEAIKIFDNVEREFKQSGIPYGYEPYVPAWDSLLGEKL